MTKRKKKIQIEPDEQEVFGPLAMARFGKAVVVKNLMSQEQHQEFVKSAAERYPIICEEIDGLVKDIRSLVCQCPPLYLLQVAYQEHFMHMVGKKSESSLNHADNMSRIVLEYVQSILASTIVTYEGEFHQNHWKEIKKKTDELYSLLNPYYHIAHTAHQKSNNDRYDPEFDEYYVKAQMLWSTVRGNRYSKHEIPHHSDLLQPHQEIIKEVFGIEVEDLLVGLEKIIMSLSRGIGDAAEVAFGIYDQARAVLTDEFIERNSSLEISQIVKKSLTVVGKKQEFEKAIAKLFQFDLFNVKKITDWPESLLKKLSWKIGEDDNFFDDDEFSGWPLRILPVKKRPFINIGDGFYCFEILNLCDNFYRVIQSAIIEEKPSYHERWNRIQKATSEKIPIKLFNKLLPGAELYPSLYFKMENEQGNLALYEIDGLILFDDHLIAIEVKGGAFSAKPPSTHFHKYLTSIKDLLFKPATQIKNFFDYCSESAGRLYSDRNCRNLLKEINLKDYRHITPCSVTVDSFTHLASQAQNLDRIGITPIEVPIWSVSIDDLRVFCDIFDSPSIFCHFLEHRQRAYLSGHITVEDEIDHLGLYLEHNAYAVHAENFSKDVELSRNPGWLGYREMFDKYYYHLSVAPEEAVKPKQNLSDELHNIIKILDEKNSPQFTRAVSYLLDMSGEARDEFYTSIKSVKERQQQLGRILPFSFFGGIDMTIYCLQPRIKTISRDERIDYVLATLMKSASDERFYLELQYDEFDVLKDVDFSFLSTQDIPQERIAELEIQAEKYAKSRIRTTIEHSDKGKIGRNDPCPCGSGKKYKHCHWKTRNA